MRGTLPALAGALLAGGCAVTADYDQARARETIWSKELAIYEARARGDLGVYLANASPRYLGWPPGWDQPSRLDKLRAGAVQMQGSNQEELTMEFADITFSGDAAVVYYDTHRTRLPTGEPVDQRFQIVHVWALENGEWKLLGAMGRTRPEALTSP